jgi:hypothetical protein
MKRTTHPRFTFLLTEIIKQFINGNWAIYSGSKTAVNWRILYGDINTDVANIIRRPLGRYI